MESKYKVTDIPDESNFYDLVAGDNVLEIPLFQRPYMWGKKHYNTLVDDIDTVYEDPTSAIFLGVIVSYSRGSGPGRPPTWMIVDGQQRVTTLYLSVMAAVYVAAQKGELDWAADMIGRYLIVRKMSGLHQNTKLIPSHNDRQQFFNIWEKIGKVKNLSSHTIYNSNPPMPPSPSGKAEGAMAAQFAYACRDLQKFLDEHDINALNSRIEVLTNRLSVVSIALREPTVAPKIFERLNNGAEPITVADLVRNEIFSRSGEDVNEAQSIFNSRWEPFVSKFREKNTDLNKFLFPYGLTNTPTIKRNELFNSLRGQWDKLSGPAEIISHLEVYQTIYTALEYGNLAIGYSSGIQKRLRRLHDVNCPSSIYSFIMSLLVRGEHSDETVKILDLIESFVFRRAICGIEPSGLHAVFKGLWRDLQERKSQNSLLFADFTVAEVRDQILSKATVLWPSDAEFKHHIINGPLYRRKVCSYALKEYENSLDSECPADPFQAEHVAPQKVNADWLDFPHDKYQKLVDTWGNLVPISNGMNPAASAKKFSDKKIIYKNSKFASVRELSNVAEWDERTILQRSEKIADWAVTRWTYGGV